MPLDINPVASRAEAWIETLKTGGQKQIPCFVASRAEAWIETLEGLYEAALILVASRAEAWIETWSLATLGRGPCVASRAEAWIETYRWNEFSRHCSCRLPRGGVD